MANIQQGIAQYPKGFTGGVTIRGLPILNSYSGNIWYVDAAGAQIGDGKFNRPFATIDTAINHAAAGDIIIVKSGHTETLVAAGAITMDVAGVSIVGEGTGNKRPVLTFTPAAASTNNVTWSAADCSFENIVCVAGLDALTNPFNISGARPYLDIEWQDGSSTVEAETVVLTTAAADNLHVNLKYLGFTAGNAVVAPIKLVGCTDGRINVDFYGVASTAVVNFITTLSTNIKVTGYVYNSGTTDGSKLVVDTIGSSTWYAEIEDGAAGTKFSGGSGSALAADDLSALGTVATAAATGAVTATDAAMAYIKQIVTMLGPTQLDTDTLGALLAGTGGIATMPNAAVPANNVNAFELLREIWAVLNGTAAGENGVQTFPTAAAAANNVSIAEVLRYISEYQVPRVVSKAIAAWGTSFTTAASPVSLFTVTGNVKCRVFMVQTTAATSTGTTGTIAIGVSGNTGGLLAAVTANGTNFPTNSVWAGDTSPTLLGEALSGSCDTWFLVGNGEDIIATIATNNMTAGASTFYCEYIPLDSSSTVVAA